ncbi:hypothetical protein FPZ42_09120 [Mucilaginibacter achroorhodeus]|uniref:Uncharacterized protein n=1 Tax=Mucilaginibacter achroorhodeus TaxID=2599294 RepID=A0A563U7A5_9SPHI|nr:hypothetical protein [Mucilaginibacter achroorhodeus]TWR27179.1 hypothetical protein FPZ42_09120 [Mucilaginibacter achroorhodeus]
MRKLIYCLLIFGAFYSKASAQTFSADDFKANLGKTKTLCDVVASVRTFSDTLTLINMGGAYPDQKYTIAVKGDKIKMDWPSLEGKNICVTGVFALHKDRPEIVATEPKQIELK